MRNLSKILLLLILFSPLTYAEELKTYEKGGVVYSISFEIDTDKAKQCLDNCATTCLGTESNEDNREYIILKSKVLEAQKIGLSCEGKKGQTRTRCEEKLYKQVKGILEIK